MSSILRVLTCGSVDDGKSTLIGRLAVETGNVPVDTIAAARSVRSGGSLVPAGEIDYSLLNDGLEAEREQGITIDVAYRSISLPSGRRLLIADSPGHEQYTRNMAVAASSSELAIIVIDINRGIRPQTLRHLAIASLMGIQRVAVIVNKIDGVNYSEKSFQEVSQEIATHLNRLGIQDSITIPVSALNGDNVVTHSELTSWYRGQTLLEFLEMEYLKPADLHLNPRLPIQLVTRAQNFRGLAGTVADGALAPGMQVLVLPSGQKAEIEKILTFDGEMNSAQPGRAVTLTLRPDIDASRGDVVVAIDPKSPQQRFEMVDEISANLVCIGDLGIKVGQIFRFIASTTTVMAVITKINSRLNIENGDSESAQSAEVNDIISVDISLERSIPLIPYQHSRQSGNFVLVDPVTARTIGAGMFQTVVRNSLNVTYQDYAVTNNLRAKQKNQTPAVLWLTGLSGSGKSTIANALDKALFSQSLHSYVLDGDNLRLGLNKDLDFTPQSRAENVRRVGEVALLMHSAGLFVIVALVSPYESDRQLAKKLFNNGDFFEIWVDTPLEICQGRDTKGLYKKAQTGNIGNMTGVSQTYEKPANPDLVLDGLNSVDVSVQAVLDFLASRGKGRQN
jgi:bifunctional enzyme CysN/CysC